MKFGKEFTSQMVPEWIETYLDYTYLKTLLKQIRNLNLKNDSSITTHHDDHPSLDDQRKLALYRVFSGLTKISRLQVENPMSQKEPDIENLVEKGDYAFYFERLDFEFKKVHGFYMSKVKHVLEEATLLEKQMHALIAFRIKVEKPDGWRIDESYAEMSRFDSEVSVSGPSCGGSSRRAYTDMEEEGTNDEQSVESADEKDVNDIKPIAKVNSQEKSFNNLQGDRPCPLQILDRVTMNVSTFETPLSTMKVLLNVPKQTELKFNKENLKKAEVQLQQAFIVFYHKLLHLKSYSFMNMLAFSKIMKKYDKFTSRSASNTYMKMVENAFLGSSNEVNQLIVRVEDTFIKYFSNSSRSKGMKILRPKSRREKHRVTCSFGFNAGCCATLILALVFIIRARHILSTKGTSQYMNTLFPLYSLFAFVVLHMIMYAGDVFFWRRYKVNYPFVLGLKQGEELGYWDVLYLSSSLGVLTLVSVLTNLDMEMDPKTLDYKSYTEIVPLIAIAIIVVILLFPFNILYRSSRYFFLTRILHCFCAPLYNVTLVDCIFADQLTSQVQAFRSLEFYICYYGWGDYKIRENNCKISDTYNTFNFIVAVIPFVIRVLQNLRLMCQQNNRLWGYNAIKYFSTIVAVCTRTAYSLDEGMTWKIVAWTSSAVAAIFCIYWDLVIDWGLLQRHSKNRWLRDKLVVPHKSVYYVAMVLNVLLRFAWLQTVLNFHVPRLHTEALIAIVASLEIIRRGLWNFFRMENEHLYNVSKFRAFKSVPLPFNYGDEEQEKNN